MENTMNEIMTNEEVVNTTKAVMTNKQSTVVPYFIGAAAGAAVLFGGQMIAKYAVKPVIAKMKKAKEDKESKPPVDNDGTVCEDEVYYFEDEEN